MVVRDKVHDILALLSEQVQQMLEWISRWEPLVFCATILGLGGFKNVLHQHVETM